MNKHRHALAAAPLSLAVALTLASGQVTADMQTETVEITSFVDDYNFHHVAELRTCHGALCCLPFVPKSINHQSSLFNHYSSIMNH